MKGEELDVKSRYSTSLDDPRQRQFRNNAGYNDFARNQACAIFSNISLWDNEIILFEYESSKSFVLVPL